MDERETSEITEGAVPSLFADDELYRALAARPRRRLLAHLLACEQCSLEELVDVLAGWETDPGTTVGPERARQVRTALLHHHLPQLEDAGLLTYDRERDAVRAESLEQPVADLVRTSVQAEEQ
jgi:hypothetical protein